MELTVIYWPYKIKSQQILWKIHEWEVKKPYGIWPSAGQVCSVSWTLRIPMTVSHVTSEHQNDAGGVESLSQPGPYVTFDWKLIFLKKSLFIPVLFFWCFKMKTSFSLTTLKRNHWTKPNTNIRWYQLLKMGKSKSCTFVQRLGITDREIGESSLFYCWCKKFWRKTWETCVCEMRKGRTDHRRLQR